MLSPPVCRPCEDDWKHFQSHCYWFRETNYFSYWTSWEASQKMCKEKLAELVVIESPEEQARPFEQEATELDLIYFVFIFSCFLSD